MRSLGRAGGQSRRSLHTRRRRGTQAAGTAGCAPGVGWGPLRQRRHVRRSCAPGKSLPCVESPLARRGMGQFRVLGGKQEEKEVQKGGTARLVVPPAERRRAWETRLLSWLPSHALPLGSAPPPPHPSASYSTVQFHTK